MIGEKCETVNDLVVKDEDLRSVGVDIYDLYNVKAYILEKVKNGDIPNDLKSSLSAAVYYLDTKY